MKSKTIQKIITVILLIIYIIALIYIILFKYSPVSFFAEYWELSSNAIGVISFNPFDMDLKDMFLNLIAFMPFGVYLEILHPERKMLLKVLPVFLTSLIFEILQYILGIGISDLWDLITNTAGGFLGMFLYRKICKAEILKWIVLIVAVLATVSISSMMTDRFIKEYRQAKAFYQSEEYSELKERMHQSQPEFVTEETD